MTSISQKNMDNETIKISFMGELYTSFRLIDFLSNLA